MTDKRKNWGISYGELVWREFKKNKVNLVSMGFIVVLFVVAVLAPFLANDKPYAIKLDGNWQFPLFGALGATDYAVFLAATIGILQVLMIKWNQKHIDPSI